MSLVTPVFRASYASVFTPKLNDLSGKEEYSVQALFKRGEDLTKLQDAVKKAIVDKWGADKNKWPNNIRLPFRDQAERAKNVDGKQILPAGYEPGAIFINLKSSNRPAVVGPDVQPILDAAEFYSGCFARASVSVYAYDQKGNRGVAFGLMNLQKVAEGEPLGGRTRPEDDFSPVTTESKPAASASDLFT